MGRRRRLRHLVLVLLVARKFNTYRRWRPRVVRRGRRGLADGLKELEAEAVELKGGEGQSQTTIVARTGDNGDSQPAVWG